MIVTCPKAIFQMVFVLVLASQQQCQVVFLSCFFLHFIHQGNRRISIPAPSTGMRWDLGTQNRLDNACVITSNGMPGWNRIQSPKSLKSSWRCQWSGWLMCHFKFIAPSPTGMRNNTIKFHLVLHLAENILDYGVPQNFNSGFAESAHISLAKDTARNTQKHTDSFLY